MIVPAAADLQKALHTRGESEAGFETVCPTVGDVPAVHASRRPPAASVRLWISGRGLIRWGAPTPGGGVVDWTVNVHFSTAELLADAFGEGARAMRAVLLEGAGWDARDDLGHA